MGDAFFVLLIIWAYHLFSVGKIKVFWLGIIYSLILLFSIPSSFFIAGVLIVEFIAALKSKDKKRILALSLSGLLVTLVFIAHYYYWLMPITKSGWLKNYWQGHRFNMFPTNIKQISHDYKLMKRLFGNLFLSRLFLIAFCGLLFAIFKKHKPSIAVALSIVLWIIASHFEKSPIVLRLSLFVYALTTVYAFVCLAKINFSMKIESLSGRLIAKINAKHLALFLIVFFLWMGRDYINYTRGGLYIRGQQANELIEYVQSNIKDDEFLYVTDMASNIVRYKNGVNNKSIGKIGNENIIWGKGRWRRNELNEDIEFAKIISAKKCYILFYHDGIKQYNEYLKKLSAFGNLKLVKNVYETRLYYFTAKDKN
jgi:hypothetical protein